MLKIVASIFYQLISTIHLFTSFLFIVRMSQSFSTRALRYLMASAITLTMAFVMVAPTQVNSQNSAKIQDCGPGDIFGCKSLGGNNGVGLSSAPPGQIIVKLIQTAMGFLGLVAVVIILYGGFKWMTAAGNEEKVEEAKKLIGAGIIGMIIILTAYALVTFVLRSLFSITAGGVGDNRF